MALSIGDKIPSAKLLRMGADGPESVDIAALATGRTVVIFAVPGAFTGTCTNAHVPSFMRTKAQFDAKGVDEVICIAVNDPFVVQAWSESTGAGAAGLTMLADAESHFTTAMGMDFSAPPVGFVSRSKRYAMVVQDGTITVLHAEESPGTCDLSAGESILEAVD